MPISYFPTAAQIPVVQNGPELDAQRVAAQNARYQQELQRNADAAWMQSREVDPTTGRYWNNPDKYWEVYKSLPGAKDAEHAFGYLKSALTEAQAASGLMQSRADQAMLGAAQPTEVGGRETAPSARITVAGEVSPEDRAWLEDPNVIRGEAKAKAAEPRIPGISAVSPEPENTVRITASKTTLPAPPDVMTEYVPGKPGTRSEAFHAVNSQDVSMWRPQQPTAYGADGGAAGGFQFVLPESTSPATIKRAALVLGQRGMGTNAGSSREDVQAAASKYFGSQIPEMIGPPPVPPTPLPGPENRAKNIEAQYAYRKDRAAYENKIAGLTGKVSELFGKDVADQFGRDVQAGNYEIARVGAERSNEEASQKLSAVRGTIDGLNKQFPGLHLPQGASENSKEIGDLSKQISAYNTIMREMPRGTVAGAVGFAKNYALAEGLSETEGMLSLLTQLTTEGVSNKVKAYIATHPEAHPAELAAVAASTAASQGMDSIFGDSDTLQQRVKEMRSGITVLPGMIRARGGNPKALLQEPKDVKGVQQVGFRTPEAMPSEGAPTAPAAAAPGQSAPAAKQNQESREQKVAAKAAQLKAKAAASAAGSRSNPIPLTRGMKPISGKWYTFNGRTEQAP